MKHHPIIHLNSFTILCLLLISVGCADECHSKRQQDADGTEKVALLLREILRMDEGSEKVELLMRVAENERLDLCIRAAAVAELGEVRNERAIAGIKNKKIVDRLLNLLPGGTDTLTLEILDTLGAIGDPKALPVLEQLSYNHGKLTAVLDHAIERCRRNSKTQ